ncbi:MAG: sensor domain-containing diguanylate cyclase [Gammaproteobacteria bacterium]|nr:MAG: sensor domain-containing diguanylate cyclase [Gammaproteobacteria bacterium]
MNPDVFQQIVECSADAIFLTDTETGREGGPAIVYVNPAFERLTGFSQDEAVGQPLSLLHGQDTNMQTVQRIHDALSNQDNLNTRLLQYRKDGRPFWVDMDIRPMFNSYGTVTHFAVFQRDITGRQRMTEHLASMADHDGMTGLLNQQAFQRALKAEIQRSQRHNTTFSVALLDIDQLKTINRSLGHDEGDRLIRAVALAIHECLREEDVLARIGGDEFAVIMPETDLHRAGRAITRFLQLLESLEDLPVEPAVSIGLTEFQMLDTQPDPIIERARQGLAQAQHRPGSSVVSVDPLSMAAG